MQFLSTKSPTNSLISESSLKQLRIPFKFIHSFIRCVLVGYCNILICKLSWQRHRRARSLSWEKENCILDVNYTQRIIIQRSFERRKCKHTKNSNFKCTEREMCACKWFFVSGFAMRFRSCKLFFFLDLKCYIVLKYF